MKYENIKVGEWYLISFKNADDNWLPQKEYSKKKTMLCKCVYKRSNDCFLNLFFLTRYKVCHKNGNSPYALKYDIPFTKDKHGRLWFIPNKGVIRKANEKEKMKLFLDEL
jgi:hypothetical protein